MLSTLDAVISRKQQLYLPSRSLCWRSSSRNTCRLGMTSVSYGHTAQYGTTQTQVVFSTTTLTCINHNNDSLYASTRCQTHSAFRHVHPRVCASWKLCEHNISKTNEGNFTQFWSQMYLGSQMCWLDFGSKGHWPENHGEYNIFVTIGANFTKIRSHAACRLTEILSQRSKVKVTAGKDITVDGSPSSSIYLCKVQFLFQPHRNHQPDTDHSPIMLYNKPSSSFLEQHNQPTRLILSAHSKISALHPSWPARSAKTNLPIPFDNTPVCTVSKITQISLSVKHMTYYTVSQLKPGPNSNPFKYSITTETYTTFNHINYHSCDSSCASFNEKYTVITET